MVNRKTSSRIKFLAFMGMTFGIIAALYSFLAVSGYQPVWFLPGLYLIEMVVVCVIAFLCVFREDWFSVIKVWLVVGVLFAFVLLGAWSVGLLFLPATLVFAIIAIGLNGPQARDWLGALVAYVIAFVSQASLMVIVIRFAV